MSQKCISTTAASGTVYGTAYCTRDLRSPRTAHTSKRTEMSYLGMKEMSSYVSCPSEKSIKTTLLACIPSLFFFSSSTITSSSPHFTHFTHLNQLLSSLSASDKPTANMQITKIITTVVATACVSTAIPTAHGDDHGKEAMVGPGGNVVCGNGQVVSCCNSKDTHNGLNVLDGLLGGNCDPLNLIGLLVPINLNKACGNNQAACCTGNQNVSISVHHPSRTFTHLSHRVSSTSNATTSILFRRNWP